MLQSSHSSRGSRRGRKRAQTAASASPLPTYVALLQDLSLSVDHSGAGRRATYRLGVSQLKKECATGACPPSECSCEQPTALPSRWTRSLRFEDCLAFHARLAAAMQHGHFCGAACVWAFSFVQSYFPKKSIFQRNSSQRTLDGRAEALQKCLLALQTFLLDRQNHSCSIVTTGVAKVFAEFVFGERALPDYLVELHSGSSRELFGLGDSLRRSSLASASEDELSDCESTGSGGGPELCGVCALELCYGPTGSDSPTDELLSPASARRHSVYATRLGCGHQFHDECIVPILNETLRCPVCDHLEIQ